MDEEWAERDDLRRIPKRGVVVAVDGPAGAGKSTLARRLAGVLRTAYLNTGAMYRELSRRSLEAGVGADDEAGLQRLAQEIRFSLGGTPGEILIDGRVPGPELQTEAIEAVVSRVSRHPGVRRVMRARQRELGAGGGVMEGRDIGRVVFPDADVKILLLADPSTRADRRELERGQGDLREAIDRRDALDAATSPLVATPSTTMVDTSGLTPEEVFREAMRIVREELGPSRLPEERPG